MFSLEIISAITFFALVGILLIKDRKNLEFRYGVVIRRWKKGKEIIDRIARKYSKIITIIGNIGVIVGILAGILSFILLIQFSLELQQAFYLVFPSVGEFKYPGPVISIPFWYWLVAIFVIIATHESMHAIFARLEKIPIKSYGILLLLVLPIGAFVDPDMKKVARLKFLKKLRIYAAGSFANFITGAIMLAISLLVSTFLFEPVGVVFGQLINNTPAFSVNMSGIITAINDKEVRTVEDLSNILNQIKVGERINIKTTEGNYIIKTISKPENESAAYIGIAGVRTVYDVKTELTNYRDSIHSINTLLFWIFVLSVGIGVANMLPIKPLDGGLIFEEILNKIFKANGKIAAQVLSFITIVLILFNLFGVGLIKFII